MKNIRLLLLPICVLLVFASCKKKSATPATTSTITVTIGGTAQTFNTGASAHVDNTNGFNSLSIIGIQSASSSNSIILTVTNTTPVVAGSYTGTSSQVDMSYSQASGAVYQFDGSNNASAATVVISSITSTNVKGTFSGTLELITGSGAVSQVLTNGAFDLVIK